MKKNSETYQAYVQILKEELVPAMGCTEPIAIAYGAARCRELLGRIPDRVTVTASGSIIKNVKSVVVPNTDGLKGIKAAAAVGILAGNAEKKLEVISRVTKEQKKAVKEFLEENKIQVGYLDGELTFDMVIREQWKEETATVRIANYHTNIVYEEKNGRILKNTVVRGEEEENLTDKNLLNMNDIWEFAVNCDIIDVKSLLDEQLACNMAICREGMRHAYGANIGKVLLETEGSSVENRAAAMAAAGSDARMNGCELPVIINSGSGNQGIACSVPVAVFAEELGSGQEKLYRALVLSNLTAIYQKQGIGRLSAFCGAVSAGIAAGAGISYLKGGGSREAFHTVVNGLAIVSGMVCDGAKASCAAKIAFSVKAGILGYEMFIRGQQFRGGDGLVARGVDNTIHNIGRLGKEGMRKTNEEIIRMMIGK